MVCDGSTSWQTNNGFHECLLLGEQSEPHMDGTSATFHILYIIIVRTSGFAWPPLFFFLRRAQCTVRSTKFMHSALSLRSPQSNRNRTPALKFICTGSTDSGRNHCNVGVGGKADTWGICGRCVRALSLYWTHFVCESPVVFVCGISSFVHLDISTL